MTEYTLDAISAGILIEARHGLEKAGELIKALVENGSAYDEITGTTYYDDVDNGNVNICEDDLMLVLIHEDGSAESWCFDCLSELIFKRNDILLQSPTADVSAYKLREAWTDLDADNLADDEPFISSPLDGDGEVYILETFLQMAGEEDPQLMDIMPVFCPTDAENVARTDECITRLYKFDGGVEDFLTDEYWMDRLGDMVKEVLA